MNLDEHTPFHKYQIKRIENDIRNGIFLIGKGIRDYDSLSLDMNILLELICRACSYDPYGTGENDISTTSSYPKTKLVSQFNRLFRTNFTYEEIIEKYLSLNPLYVEHRFLYPFVNEIFSYYDNVIHNIDSMLYCCRSTGKDDLKFAKEHPTPYNIGMYEDNVENCKRGKELYKFVKKEFLEFYENHAADIPQLKNLLIYRRLLGESLIQPYDEMWPKRYQNYLKRNIAPDLYQKWVEALEKSQEEKNND